MAIEDFQQHGETAKADLLTQFKDKPNLAAVIDAVGTQLNELDATLVDLVLERTLDTAIGEQLDQLARVVAIERGSSDDDELRARIKAEIRLNRSCGTIEDILEVLVLVEGDVAIRLAEFAPAALTVDVGETAIVDTLVDLVKRTRAAGVGAQVIYSEVAAADTFTFSSGDTQESSAAQGWADDAQTTGGRFADAEGA